MAANTQMLVFSGFSSIHSGASPPPPVGCFVKFCERLERKQRTSGPPSLPRTSHPPKNPPLSLTRRTDALCLSWISQGGMVHRDSMGLKQQYGPNAVQWMSAGRGILHEEMWDIRDKWEKADMELYQIWVGFGGLLSLDVICRGCSFFRCPVLLASVDGLEDVILTAVFVLFPFDRTSGWALFRGGSLPLSSPLSS